VTSPTSASTSRTLTEAANAAYAVLQARDVDVEGVAPVLQEGAVEAGQQAIDGAVTDGGQDDD